MRWSDRARKALRRVLPGLFRSRRLTPPGWAADRRRILLLGPTGAGKSSLVNAVLGAEVAAAVPGAPVTSRSRWYGEGLASPYALCDTRGLEAAESEAQVAALLAEMAALPPEGRPEIAWLIVNAEGGRAFTGQGTLSALGEALRAGGIPCLTVLTHAEPGAEAHAGLRARLGAGPVVAVNLHPLRGEDGTLLIPEHGLDRLLEETQSLLDDRGRPAPGP